MILSHCFHAMAVFLKIHRYVIQSLSDVFVEVFVLHPYRTNVENRVSS